MADNGKKPYSTAFVTFWLILNIVVSIGVVFVNKIVYVYYGFPNVTLTCVHFLCTTVGILICRLLGIFKPKSLPILKMMPITISFCGFVVLTNLSLQYNTVGTYQLIKKLTTPGVIVIQSLYYGRVFSTKVKLTMIPIGLGVFLNSFYDLKFNTVGLMYALAGVIVTSLYQVWIGEKQQELEVDSMQLLYYQAPLSALTVSLLIPLYDPLVGEHGLLSPWKPEAIGMVLMSGAIAFLVNLSIFWVIGNTSPLTYNMVGHFKFSLTLLGGFLIFHDPIQMMQSSGIVLTILGVLLYTYIKLNEGKPLSTNQIEETSPDESTSQPV